MDPEDLTREIKEYYLSHEAELVGILTPDAINAMPEYWIDW